MVQTSSPIGRYVDVRKHPTVVRLDHLQQDDAGWITSSFYITRDIQDHLTALCHALAQRTGCGMFLVGQYGSGKSHWLSYVACQLQSGLLVPNPPQVTPLSLLNFRAATPLEEIVSDALGIAGDHADRREPWRKLCREKPGGLILLVDELSEFLRSKPNHRALNEDVRFLQFMGEWAQEHRFWIVAAMQEGIEHTGELEYGLYRKIKDRFPLRFLLTPTHVKDLIQESILVKKEGYQEAVETLATELRAALPDCPISYEDLVALYPLHPATLDLLEEVRDRFSQARGIVDFTVTQLRGDPARGIEPFLDRPWGSLLAPDLIIDHFRDLLELQPEFLPLAQQLFPYYRKRLPEMFSSPTARELAERLLKLLALNYLSPRRGELEPHEAAHWLLFRVTRIDPKRNLDIIGRMLRQLVDDGRYVVQHQGGYRLELRDEGTSALEAFLRREKEALKDQGEMVFEQLVEQLGEEELNPLALPRDQWQRRSVRWHFHERPYFVYVGNDVPPPTDGAALCIRLPWGVAGSAPGCYTVQPNPIPLDEELLELAALLRARSRPWSSQVSKRLERRIGQRLALFRTQIRTAYLGIRLTSPSGESETPPQVEPAAPLRRWLDQYAEWMMRRMYPAFDRFAPAHGPLAKEAYRSLMRFAAGNDLGDYDADEYVKLIREAYLVPMRLVRRQGRGYEIAANLEGHELVRLVRPLVELQPSPALIYENLSTSVYGLVPDQIALVLIFLLILGELDIVKQRHSYRELYETLPDPLQYDKVVPCSALALEQLHELEVLCEGLHVRVPKEWTVLAQRRGVRQLREALQRHTVALRSLLVKLQQAGQAEKAAERVRQVLGWEQSLEKGSDPLSGFQQFLFEIGSARRFLATLAELSDLPGRLDRLLSELKRYQHLLGHPALANCADPAVAIRIEALEQPPSLEQPDALEEWLKQSRALYDEYKNIYRKGHDQWWKHLAAKPIWGWKPPAVAGSRHLGLEEALEELRSCRAQVERQRCHGLVNLDFQPLCVCGFDGRTSPAEEKLKRLEALRDRVERSVTQFFQQEAVRCQLRQWVEQGLEVNERTLAYLEGNQPYPEISNLELLDRHLAGVELVKELDAGAVVELLCERTWEKGALVDALTGLVNQLAGPRLRFRPPSEVSGLSELVVWCAEQALRYGVALPQTLGARIDSDLVDSIRPEWVSAEALVRLEKLGFGQNVIDRIITWMLDGQLKLPRRSAKDAAGCGSSPLVAAAAEVLRPSRPSSAEQLAELAEQLYRAHHAMLPIAGARWLERLESLARSAVPAVPALPEALGRYRQSQHLLIDCLGLPLLGALREQLDVLLPHWRLEETTFALVSSQSTTDACYRQLIEADFRERLEKINRIDSLLHDRYLPFDDFCRVAIAELAIACKVATTRLDAGHPLVVFADHGFRIAPDGRSYCHGGDSALERLVPVLHLVPR